MRYDAILFDFDGVLADTEPLHFACWRDVLAPLGIHVDWQSYRNCIGLSERDTVAFFGPVEELWPHYPRKKALFRERSLSSPPLSEATRELLKSLSGMRMAVVSSSATAEIRPILEAANILDAFGAFVFAEDVARHKPAPDPYLLAAERLGARRPLVVEDSETGLASGRAAGFDVLHIPDPARLPELLRRALI